MDANIAWYGTDSQQMVSNPLVTTDGVVELASPLALNIDDKELVKIVKERIEASEKFYESKYNLKQRREKNERFLFGRQVAALEQQGKLKDYEARSSDNVLYETEGSLKALATSKLPDIIITAGVEGDPKRDQSAKDLSIAVNDTNKQRELREEVGLGFKHLPSYFTAVLKARWVANKGEHGDFEFKIINPDYIIASHTATSKRADDMDFVAQVVPSKIQELFMKFPKKKDELKVAFKESGVNLSDDPTWKELATEVNIYEVWFDWYRRKKDKQMLTQDEMSLLEPGVEWEKVTCVLWKYNNVILDKMLDPNYDWEGEDVFYSYQVPGDETTKIEVKPEDMLMSAMTGIEIPNLTKEKIYHNYFKASRKPYYFFGYDQWGKIPYDETSRIEQNIRNQENLDDQNKTIMDQIKQRMKHIWSKDSGMKSADVQKLDLDDNKMDALVEGDPNKVHKGIAPERPDQAQFNALELTRQRMYAISHTTAIRGALQTDVATSNQIGREGDFNVTDDLAENTINSCFEWISEWQVHFIKLRYTEEHTKQIVGSGGSTTYLRIRRDTYSDGMEVKTKATSTDKLKAQRNAMETAALGAPYTNPIDFFRDMDMDDPEGRTERGLMFSADPAGYFAKYALHLDGTQQMAAALNAPAPMQGQPPVQQPTGAPQGATPVNTSAVPAQPPMQAPAQGQGML